MGEPSMHEVLDELQALRREVAELRALQSEVELLRRQVAASPGLEAAPAAGDLPDPPGAIDRRRALRAGLVAAGAAAAAVALDAAPAAAANGSPITLGSQGNTATAATITSVSASPRTVGFGIWDVSRAALEPDIFPAISGHAQGASFNVGVEGIGTGFNPGVRGQCTGGGSGVSGLSNGTVTGFGVTGSGGSAGVYGSSGSQTGVLGQSNTGIGVDAATFLTGTDSIGIRTTGKHAHLRFRGTFNGDRLAPTADTAAHLLGDVVFDKDGHLWLCTVSGTPGTWRRLAGPTSAGAFHVLTAPARVYDSRPGTAPAVGSKTKLVPNTPRVLDVKANGSGVPAGATAAMLTVLLVNAAAGSGNLTVWANGVTKPAANTMVWGPGGGRFTATAVSALSGGAGIQVASSLATDIVIDVVGYYR